MRESVVSGMPNLHAFDQEFGREGAPRQERRRKILRLSTIVAFLMGAGIVGALALAWPETVALLRAELPPEVTSLLALPHDGSDEQIARLLTEVDALKQEVHELTQAQHAAADTIASLKAAEQKPQSGAASASWYSDPAALNFATPRRSAAGSVAPPAQQSATARPKSVPLPKRESAAPLPLQAPQ
jgi:hypothetical protein